MSDVGWKCGGRGAGGGWGGALSILPVLDQFIILSARFEHFTASGDSGPFRQLCSTLYHPLDVTHMINAPFFTALLFPCIIVNAN